MEAWPDRLRGPWIVVEYMEEYPSRWLVEEIAEAYWSARAHGLGFLVSNAWDPRLVALLERRGIPYNSRPASALGCEPSIVLDMRARRRLEPWEAGAAECLVVGGIMGDYPPRGRGLLLVYSLPGAAVRSLGPEQMSIHTAAKVAALIARGRRLDEIRLAGPGRFTVETPLGTVEVELPYAYTLGPDGRPEVPERVRRVLERGVLWEEYW
ncbi:MAG: hypothetical protein F7C34_03870 [Desulfurococcales archaeon]|nr:hypothetical protein [Desulfurococcales archaeon]